MSFGIHQRIRQRRQFGSNRLFDKQIYADKFMLSYMTLERELPGHAGCVNTLDWSIAGDKLLTGSDDTTLNIYYTYEDYRCAESIDTGHRANIFTAKFMPQTSDNVILSGAGDSELRIFDLNHPESPLDSMYVCHSDQLKKICVFQDNPNEFLTCSQDGTVRHFDRRTPHMCSPHNVRSFITAQTKPARQYPLPKCKEMHYGCPAPIVDYGKYNIELNSMTINKVFPHYFAVAGVNDYIFLHDMRMMHDGKDSEKSQDVMKALKCVKRFSPTSDGINRPNRHITACKFSDANGYELLGSWSGDSIYLFNINDDAVESSFVTASKRNSSSNGTAHRSPSFVFAEEGFKEIYEYHSTLAKKWIWLEIFPLDATKSSIISGLHDSYDTESRITLNTIIGSASTLMLKIALVFLRCLERSDWVIPRDADSTRPEWTHYFFEHEIESINDDLQTAIDIVEPTETWQAHWCYSVGLWIIRGGHQSLGNLDRRDHLDLCVHHLCKARQILTDEIERRMVSSEYTCDENTYQINSMYLHMMNCFLEDVNKAIERETPSQSDPPDGEVNDGEVNDGEVNDSEVNDSDDDTIRTRPWEDIMLITMFSPQAIRDFLDMGSSSEDDEGVVSRNSESSMSEDEDMDQVDEHQVELYTRIMSRQIMDIYRRGSIGEDSEDSDLDLEELAEFREYTQQTVETDVGVVKPRSKFAGHCNIETIKDVDFYGPNDEYIVSGSDGGYVFIWNKKTTEIVQILQADNEIVNVVKGHPSLPLLAVSGIDSTTKIFTPISRPLTHLNEPNNPEAYSTSSRMHERQAILSSNEESNSSIDSNTYITRAMIAALSRIGRQYSTHTDDSSNSDSDAESNQ